MDFILLLKVLKCEYKKNIPVKSDLGNQFKFYKYENTSLPSKSLLNFPFLNIQITCQYFPLNLIFSLVLPNSNTPVIGIGSPFGSHLCTSDIEV